MHNLGTVQSKVRTVDGTSGGSCILRQRPVRPWNKTLDSCQIVSRGKMSISHRHLNCLVPHQFRQGPKVDSRHSESAGKGVSETYQVKPLS